MGSTVISQPMRHEARRMPRAADPDDYSRLFLVAGAAFMVIGWTDISLLWYPLQLRSIDWEFATVTASINAMPLPTLGLVLLAAAGIARRSKGLMRIAAVFAVLAAVLVVAMAGLYVLALLAGRPAMDPGMKVLFARAAMKTSVLTAVYVLLHGWLGWTLFRSAQRRKESHER